MLREKALWELLALFFVEAPSAIGGVTEARAFPDCQYQHLCVRARINLTVCYGGHCIRSLSAAPAKVSCFHYHAKKSERGAGVCALAGDQPRRTESATFELGHPGHPGARPPMPECRLDQPSGVDCALHQCCACPSSAPCAGLIFDSSSHCLLRPLARKLPQGLAAFRQ